MTKRKRWVGELRQKEGMFEAGVNAAKHMPGRLKCIVPEVKNLGCPDTGSRIPKS